MTPSPPLVWFLIGVAFLIAELIAPGFVLIFFAAGSWIAAVVLLLTDIALRDQILIFAASSLVLLFALRKYSMKVFHGTTLERDDDRYMDSKIGRTAVVTKTIERGAGGEIKMMGSFWRAVADERIEAGRSVVVDAPASEDGLTFKVKPL